MLIFGCLGKLLNSEWNSDLRKRTKSLPHIKTYCRISDDCTKMSWFLLTSANLSKAAWGKKTLSDQSDYILSYEAGVLFVPQFVVICFILFFFFTIIIIFLFLQTGCDAFSVGDNQQNSNSSTFPLPFDLPLTSYRKNDQPWVAN